MIEFLQSVLTDSISIFTIMNPLSAGVIMLTLLDKDATKTEVTQTAHKNTKAVFIAMLAIYLIGIYLFDFFGISVHGLRTFGGLILLVMGFNMVQGHGKKVNHSPKETEYAREQDDISTVPLAIPIIVGPGLATTLINMSSSAVEWEDYLSGILAILITSLASLLILRRMPFIKKHLGDNGLKVFNRLMGLIVGSLAAQMIINGISGYYADFVS